MQREYALLNLKEAKSSIEQIIGALESDADYDLGNYVADIQHLYWHINRAWNGREFDIESQKLTGDIDDSFIQFPKDLVL